MSDTTAGLSQTVVSFTSEGTFGSIRKCVDKVTAELTNYLAQSKSRGELPAVVNISQSTGYIGHIGCYATITAVIAK